MDSINSANRQIARAAGTVMAAFVVSNLAGLARQILVANAFGTQAEMEAFNAANRVAETLFNLVAGGALSSAFIPTFTTLLTRDRRDEAWRLASSIANLILIILTVFAALAAVFAPQIVRYVIAPGFAATPEKEQLTVELLRLMLPSAVIFGLSGLVMGVLNSNQVFLIPSLTPSVYQLGMIFGVLALSPSLGIFGLAWGVLIGAALHLVLQIPSLFKLKGSYSWTLGLDSPDVREVARLMGPRLLGVAFVQLNFWVNTRLASAMPEGSVTGVVLAFTVMLMPQAAIAQSIAIAALPTFSAQYAAGKVDEMRRSLGASLRGVMLLSLPATVGLVILREPIVTLLYQRGEFDLHSTELVAWALLWYAVGLVGHALVEILARAFYSLHDTLTPVLVGIGAMCANVGLSIWFAALFERVGWMPHGGLALANTLATAVEGVILFFLMRKRLSGIGEVNLWRGVSKVLLVSLVMAAVLFLWMEFSTGFPVWMAAVGGIGIGITGFILASWALGVPEVISGIKWLVNRLRLRSVD